MNELNLIEKSLNKIINKSNTEEKVVDFLTDNKAPIKDTKFHKLAEDLNIDPSKIEEIVYSLLNSILAGGKSKGKKPKGLTDEKEKQGMKVEAEHTANPELQRKIVYDHITEDPNYYDKLKTIEKSLKNIIYKANLPTGTVREWQDGKYQKQSDGQWVKITEEKEKIKKPNGKNRKPKNKNESKV